MTYGQQHISKEQEYEELMKFKEQIDQDDIQNQDKISIFQKLFKNYDINNTGLVSMDDYKEILTQYLMNELIDEGETLSKRDKQFFNDVVKQFIKKKSAKQQQISLYGIMQDIMGGTLQDLILSDFDEQGHLKSDL